MKGFSLISIIVAFLMLWNMAGTGTFLPAQDTSGGDVETLYRDGVAAHQAKDYKTFLDCFQRLDELLPNHPIVLYNLAAAYSLNNRSEEALTCLKQLLIVDANPKIAVDSDFDNIRQAPGFQELLSRLNELQKPISTSKAAFIIKERDLHPESIAYDSNTNTFYLGSVHKRKIVSIAPTGEVTDFTTEGQDGLDAVLGMRIDSNKRVLWAASAAAPQMKGYDEKLDKGRTGVFKYNLDTKTLIKKYILREGDEHGFDDVVLHPEGDLYISDNKQVYCIRLGNDQIVPAVRDFRFKSVQGIDFCDKGKKLLVADYVSGVYLVEVESGKVITQVQPVSGTSLRGIDGLYYHKRSNSLIAIHNGLKPQRVMQYFLSGDFSEVVENRVIEWANPAFNEPTLGVVVKNTFYYIANSQWKSYNKDFTIFPPEKLQDIIILEAPLEFNSPEMIPKDGSPYWKSVGRPGFSDHSVQEVSLFVDNRTPYVAFVDEKRTVRLTQYIKNEWQNLGQGFTTLEDDLGSVSLQVQKGVPYIAFPDAEFGGHATVMQFQKGKWIPVGERGFSGDTPFNIFLRFDNGIPYMCYMVNDFEWGYPRVWVFRDGKWRKLWEKEIVNHNIRYLSFDVYNGIPYVAYVKPSGTGAAVQAFREGKWQLLGNADLRTEDVWDTDIRIIRGIPYVALVEGEGDGRATLVKFQEQWLGVGEREFSPPDTYLVRLQMVEDTPYVAGFINETGGLTVMVFRENEWTPLAAPDFLLERSRFGYQRMSFAVSGDTPYLAFPDADRGNRLSVISYE